MTLSVHFYLYLQLLFTCHSGICVYRILRKCFSLRPGAHSGLTFFTIGLITRGYTLDLAAWEEVMAWYLFSNTAVPWHNRCITIHFVF